MSRSTTGPVPAEGRWEQWAVRQAIRAGRRPWAATFVIALALLALGGVACALFAALAPSHTSLPWRVASIAWVGGIGGAGVLSSALLGRYASSARVAVAWLGCTVVLPALAFVPLLVYEGPLRPLNSLGRVAIHLALTIPVLVPAVIALLFRWVSQRPARRSDAVILTLLLLLALPAAEVGEARPTPGGFLTVLTVCAAMTALPLCWWIRAPRRRVLHLLVPVALAQLVMSFATFDIDASMQTWLDAVGVPVMLLGALPFAFVARAADSLTVVPPGHAIHDWRRS